MLLQYPGSNFRNLLNQFNDRTVAQIRTSVAKLLQRDEPRIGASKYTMSIPWYDLTRI